MTISYLTLWTKMHSKASEEINGEMNHSGVAFHKESYWQTIKSHLDLSPLEQAQVCCCKMNSICSMPRPQNRLHQ